MAVAPSTAATAMPIQARHSGFLKYSAGERLRQATKCSEKLTPHTSMKKIATASMLGLFQCPKLSS